MRLIPRSLFGKFVLLVLASVATTKLVRLANQAQSSLGRSIPAKLLADPEFRAWVQDPDNNDRTVKQLRAAHPGFDLSRVDEESVLENLELIKAMGAYVATRTVNKLFKRDRKEQGDSFDKPLEQLGQALLGMKPTPTKQFLAWLWDENNTYPDAVTYREQHPHLRGADPEDYQLGIELGNLMIEFTIETTPQLAWLSEDPELDEMLEKAGLRDAMDRSFRAWLWDSGNTHPQVLAFRAAHPDLGPDSPKEAYPSPSVMRSVLGIYVRRITSIKEESAD